MVIIPAHLFANIVVLIATKAPLLLTWNQLHALTLKMKVQRALTPENDLVKEKLS